MIIFRKLLTTSIAVAFVTAISTTSTLADTRYLCGNENFSADVTLSSTKYKADIKIYNGQISLSGTSDETGYSKAIKFLPKATPPHIEIGTESYPCSIDYSSNETVYHGAIGKSLGGKVRGGPGSNFKQIDGLDYNTPVEIVADTGIAFGKYNWIEIVYGDKVGFQWGGLICSENQFIPTVYEVCVPKRSAKDALNTSVEGWMAFAIGSNNRFGHGTALSQAEAETFAIKNCGDDCSVDDVTHAQCHALATVPGGYWYGEAHTEKEAQSLALNACTASGYNCELKFSQCRND